MDVAIVVQVAVGAACQVLVVVVLQEAVAYGSAGKREAYVSGPRDVATPALEEL